MAKKPSFKNKMYVGPIMALRGKTAIVMSNDDHTIRAQFNDLKLEYDGTMLAFNWHVFPRNDFKNIKRKLEKGTLSWRKLKKRANKQEG